MAKRNGRTSRKNIRIPGKTVDGFVNFSAKLGQGADNQFSGGRYSFGPFLSRNRQELEAAYRSSWVVGQVVDAIAEDMTKKGAEISSEMTPEDMDALRRAMGRLRVWPSLCSTLKWARLFGGGIAVVLIEGQDPVTPLRIETIKKGQFKGFLVLDRWLVQPSLDDVITDFGIDLGAPRYYDVIGDAAALPNIRIHHSRVIRLEGIELNYYGRKAENGWGISEIERMHDRLIAFDSATQGAAQLVFKAHLRGIGVKGLRNILSMGGKMEEALIKMFEYVRMFQSNEGLTLLDSEDQFWVHQYSFSGLAEMIIQFGQQISGATGIPLVRLFGQSPAGLNSTGEADLRNYYDKINAQQETHLRPALAEKVYPVLSMSVLGKPLPDDFDFVFPSLWQMPDKEKVDVAKVVTDAVGEAYDRGIVGRRTALKELKQLSKTSGIWSNITDEMIEAADDEVRAAGENPLFETSFQENQEPEEKSPGLPDRTNTPEEKP